MVKKTFKREISIAFAAVLLYMVFTNNVEMVEVVVWPFVTFIAAASGIHTWKLLEDKPSKSSDRGRP